MLVVTGGGDRWTEGGGGRIEGRKSRITGGGEAWRKVEHVEGNKEREIVRAGGFGGEGGGRGKERGMTMIMGGGEAWR